MTLREFMLEVERNKPFRSLKKANSPGMVAIIRAWFTLQSIRRQRKKLEKLGIDPHHN